MSQLRIFSYLPNPRIWKATIAARLTSVDLEIRGTAPKKLQSWLWDFDARPLSEEEEKSTPGEVRGRVGFKGALHKTAAFLQAHPFGTVPAAFGPDGKVGIFESNSIMRRSPGWAKVNSRCTATIPTKLRESTASWTRVSCSREIRKSICSR